MAKPKPDTPVPDRPTRVTPEHWAALHANERRFVAHLVAHPDATQVEAGMAAGLRRAKTGGASEMANRPRVREALAALHAEALDAAKVDAEFVVREALDVLHGAKQDKQWGAANGTLTLLAKMRGGLTDKMQVTFRDVSQLSDEELEAEARTLGIA